MRRSRRAGGPDDILAAVVSVGLVMIVKNEERTLPRLAASLRGQLSYWTVVDTGSTDGTKDMVATLFDVPGQLVCDEFRGFGPSRNVALEAGRGRTDWLLTLDADETVEGDIRAAVPAADGFDGVEARQQHGQLSFWTPYLLRSTSPWRWEGRTHEYLGFDRGVPRVAQSPAFRVHHHADGGARSDKLERDLRLLMEDLADRPDDPRTWFYLARTYEDMARWREAAEHYRHRAGLEGWDEEGWYSEWRLGCCLVALGRSDEAAGRLMRSWQRRPWRAEPLWSLAEHYRSEGMWRLAWEVTDLGRRHTAAMPDGEGRAPDSDRLFVHDDVYSWRLAYERSIDAYYVDEMAVGRRMCDYLLARRDLPDDIRATVVKNATFYL